MPALNALLEEDFPVRFDRITAADVRGAVRAAVARAERGIGELAGGAGGRTFALTVARLDEEVSRVERVSGIVEHLMNVWSTPALRAAHAEAQPEYERFFARIDTDPAVWGALREYAETAEARALAEPRRFYLERALRELRHAGASLPAASRERVAALRVELSELQTRFENQVLDSRNAFSLHLREAAEVAGLPASLLSLARREAAARGVDGWVFTLHAPSYAPFQRYAERRDLRRRMHEAHVSVASRPPYDNRPVIARILAARRELAALLGRESFAQYAAELNMVGSAARAEEFVALLTTRTAPHFRAESEALEAAAGRQGYARLEPWDVAFLAERLRRERFDIDEEALRPYFPLPRVLEGLFEIAGRLFGVQVEERATQALWHPDVRYFELRDDAGVHRASFYLDLFPRPTKRGGAWKEGLVTGGPAERGFEPHLIAVCANFTPPPEGGPPLLTHGEVETLFHEFGHLLHAALSTAELKTRSGTRVPRDFVELPSQIMENWCWEPEALPLFSGHVDSGEPIPGEVVERLRRSRDFRSASAQMRQLGFGAVDLDLHAHAAGDPLARGREVLGRYAVRPDFADNDFLCAFTHIFGGGYAAAYHSYKWSEMLDADAFTRFKREGLLSRAVGEAFAEAILRPGLSAEPDALYRAFMGRGPEIGPLLARTLPAGAGGGAAS